MANRTRSRKNLSPAKKRKAKRWLFLVLAIFVILLASAFYALWRMQLKPAINSALPNDQYFYIRSTDTYADVLKRFEEQKIINDFELFEWTLEQKNYPKNVKPGRYKFNQKMSLNAIADMLRSGEQIPVRITLQSQQNFEDLARVLGQYFEPTEKTFLEYFIALQEKGFKRLKGDALYTLILPNSYDLYWNSSPADFMERMALEHQNFWTKNDRFKKAKSLNLKPSEVYILASIVQKETLKKDELPTIAGVYYNRLKQDMLLQADPTLVYALDERGINRVLNRDKKIDNPYNTYRYKGLPPGPICMASFISIDAVLNREDHNYLFFCAKEDFSGYHTFATTYREHLSNARKYQRALNQRKIYR